MTGIMCSNCVQTHGNLTSLISRKEQPDIPTIPGAVTNKRVLSSAELPSCHSRVDNYPEWDGSLMIRSAVTDELVLQMATVEQVADGI
jgi:hypothetical protein